MMVCMTFDKIVRDHLIYKLDVSECSFLSIGNIGTLEK